MNTTIDRIQAASASPITDTRVYPDNIPVGSGGDQGDLIIRRLPDDFDVSRLQKVSVRQLAPGTTQGSRHIVEEGVEVYAPANINTVVEVTTGKFKHVGHVLKSAERFRIEHPEHAAHSLPAGCWEISHQVDLQSMQRVKD